MTLKEAQRKFKQHYRYLTKLKEGGIAWKREILICKTYKDLCVKLYNKQWQKHY